MAAALVPAWTKDLNVIKDAAAPLQDRILAVMRHHQVVYYVICL